MTRRISTSRITSLALVAALALFASGLRRLAAASQTQSPPLRGSADEKTDQDGLRPTAASPEAIDPYLKNIYRTFYDTYKLGPADEIAVRVFGQPDYSFERLQVSPVGRIYHPLVGDVDVAGLTVSQLIDRLTGDFGQYVVNPKVSVSLVAANSAKIGVLGDVGNPGIIVMARPMTVLDAITASGGVTDGGSKSNITLLRQIGGGETRKMTVNVKRILESKASPEENVTLQAGDTLIVHGNLKKKVATITSMMGFGRFLDFIVRR